MLFFLFYFIYLILIMSAKFPRGGGGAGPFLARSLLALIFAFLQNLNIFKTSLRYKN